MGIMEKYNAVTELFSRMCIMHDFAYFDNFDKMSKHMKCNADCNDADIQEVRNIGWQYIKEENSSALF